MARLISGIDELLTLSGVAKKEGRRIKAEDLSIIKKGAILEENGKILWVGPRAKFKSPQKKLKIKPVKLDVACAMPAFVDCHTHLLFAGDRQDEFEMRNQGGTYQEIAAKGGGIAKTVKCTRDASSAQLIKNVMGRLQRLEAQGVGTVEIKTGYGLSPEHELRHAKVLMQIAKKSSIKVVPTFLGAHSKSPETPDYGAYLDLLIKECFPKLKSIGVSRVDIFIENGFFSAQQGQKYFEAAQKHGLKLVGHVEQLSQSGGTDQVISNRGLSADHLVHVSDAQIQKLAASDTVAVLLPVSDLYLKINYPPARKLIDAGAIVALSTDYNPGSSPSMDFSLLGVLARLQMKMTLPEVLSAITFGGAKALGLETEIGSLEIGKSSRLAAFNDNWDKLFYEIGYHPIRE